MNIKTTFKSKNFRKYLANTSWLLSEKIIRIALNLAVTALLARYLGPAKFGILSYAQSFVALFAAFATLGLDQIVTRDLVQGKKNVNQLLGTCFILKVLGGLSVILILFFTTGFTEPDSLTRWMIIIISFTALFQSSSTFIIYFQAIVKSKNIAIAQSLSMIIASCFKLALLLNNASLIWFAIALAVEQLITLVLLITVYLINGKTPFTWRYNGAMAIDLLKESWPLIFSSVVIVLYARIDQVMINEMLGEVAVGHYAVAVRLSEATSFITTIIITSLFPAVVKAKEKGVDVYERTMQNVLNVIVLINIFIAICTMFISDGLITLLFGIEFLAAATVLNIHVWGILFAGLGVACTRWLILEGLQRYRLYRTIMGVIMNVVLNYYLIPDYGIEGAAVATLISQISASYIGNLLSKKTRYIFKLQTKAMFLFYKIK